MHFGRGIKNEQRKPGADLLSVYTKTHRVEREKMEGLRSSVVSLVHHERLLRDNLVHLRERERATKEHLAKLSKLRRARTATHQRAALALLSDLKRLQVRLRRKITSVSRTRRLVRKQFLFLS